MKKTSKNNTMAIHLEDGHDEMIHEAADYGSSLIFVSGALIGIWAISCLVGALVDAGALGVIQGYLSATISI